MVSQLRLQFEPFRNCSLFSSHWLEKRLRLELEWEECRNEAEAALNQLRNLWAEERPKVKLYGAEASLEYAFIQPVFELLGWKLHYQTWLRGREPDYALFLSKDDHEKALNAGRKSDGFWQCATVVADAKAWETDLDRRINAKGQREYPPEQIEWYLERSHLDFGILTNGSLWRLSPRVREPYQPRFETYFEFDLLTFMEEVSGQKALPLGALEDFLYFFLLFGPAAFRERLDRVPLIQRALQGSSDYRIGVGEDLRERAFEAVRLATEGFLAYPSNKLEPAADLDLCRRESFVLIYRLLFIMFAEDRGLLPFGVNRLYTENRSLRRHRDEIGARLDQFRLRREHDYSKDRHDLFDDLRTLFDLVDSGQGRYQVPPYNGGLFDAENHPFLENKRISDWHLARAIDYLGRAKDRSIDAEALFRVDYRDLAIQHLGGIYEGLLELEPRYASTPMVVVSKIARDHPEEKIIPQSHSVPDGFESTSIRYEVGQVFLQTNKGERRAYGSYYTPDDIVNHIVENTLRPLCQKISEELEAEIATLEQEQAANPNEDRQKRIDQLKEDFDDRILRLRVVDPAMGSGHFLLRACTYLAEEIATNPYTSDASVEEMGGNESALIYWKRRVAENCLYGVDLNPLAAELAKLAMWLETVAVKQPLTFLDHHFRHGNSLIGARIHEMGSLPNAPALYTNLFEDNLHEKIPLLLKPLEQILQAPSNELSQVKQKDKLFKSLERIRKPFRDVANIWCSEFILPDDAKILPDDYRQLLDKIGRPRKFADAIEADTFENALSAVNRPDFTPFHWEIEFPEVFFDGSGKSPRPGFDAVIGNPPYDVLSERESGHDLAALKAFIEYEPVYNPSQRGKNNLYKLFICRALDLLAEDGRMGFITPMAVLGDDQAAELRRAMLSCGTFLLVDAFPQKDNPAKRVFREAKLSTAVFILHKTQSQSEIENSFNSRVHPGRELDKISASLFMTRDQIPTYDPSNCTIISCDQEDIDLATRIMRSQRMQRLGGIAESFQGEVNETNDRKRNRISYDDSDGPEVIRGAHVCLYCLREASQGTSVFLKTEAFVPSDPNSDQKANHHRYRRVGFQRKAPQNNFRRLIGTLIDRGTFLLESVSYFPEHKSKAPLELVLAVINSQLAEWYFRLGSTNAMVGEYQVNNLPFPCFSTTEPRIDQTTSKEVINLIESGRIEKALSRLELFTEVAPFDSGLIPIICNAVDRISEIEKKRGEIARSARSALSPKAQPYQDFLDQLFYRLAGLSEEESRKLETRLANML